MSNTYTQLYIQFVFATKFRTATLQDSWDEELRKYIAGIIANNGHKMLAINNMPDHLHLFIGLHPTQSISELMRLVKGDSSEWVNKERHTKSKFQWQDGYGAFSYGRSQVDAVVQYIANQQAHHQKVTFIDEYKQLLEKFGVQYDERYIFKLPE
jgi:REP element-mobilizing transposase RayT